MSPKKARAFDRAITPVTLLAKVPLSRPQSLGQSKTPLMPCVPLADILDDATGRRLLIFRLRYRITLTANQRSLQIHK